MHEVRRGERVDREGAPDALGGSSLRTSARSRRDGQHGGHCGSRFLIVMNLLQRKRGQGNADHQHEPQPH